MIQTVPLPSQELRARVAAFAPWSQDGRWEALFGGRTNAAWQVSRGADSLVLKLYRASNDNPLFPNDAKSEALMLSHLADLRLAPELVAHFETPEGSCTLYHAIPGDAWQKDVTPVASMMQTLHQQPIPKGLRTIANGSQEILAHADAILNQCGPNPQLAALRPTAHVPATSDTVLLHCDMVPGNLITNPKGLYLIDWQCPAQGDACEDIAMFLSPAMQSLYRGDILSASEVSEFLVAYPSQADRYRALAPAYHFRMAAYCAWQVENGVPDYEAGLQAEIAALRDASA